jgi:Na+-transporting NADH:ubiquinone oxidoreductase subunit C
MKDLKMILFMLVLFSFCALLLSSAQLLYERASAIFARRLYAVVLDLYAISFAEAEVEEVFFDHFEIRRYGNTEWYVSKDRGQKRVVFETEGPGLWSTLEILLSLDPETEQVHGLRVLAQGETPGLGGRISELGFQERFEGIDYRSQLEIVKFAVASNEVDAISGATKTSQALQVIINQAVELFDEHREAVMEGAE